MSLSSKVKTAVMAGVLVVAGLGAAALPAAMPAYAEPASNLINNGINATNLNGGNNLEGTVTNVINVVLYVVGILAVVMVIIGGVKYTTSGGDQAAVTSAKNTILYGIIGLVIAILAYAIVNFVVRKVA
ncbi:hypothetical protein IJG96_02195 [Candidatus Saccharibacteria bacterium]|nr:hypothetical protein [Candidatus Saccharibacteria bacterium]